MYGPADLPRIEELTGREPVPKRVPGELAAWILHHAGLADASPATGPGGAGYQRLAPRAGTVNGQPRTVEVFLTNAVQTSVARPGRQPAAPAETATLIRDKLAVRRPAAARISRRPRNPGAWNHALRRGSEVSSAMLADRTGEDWDDLLSAEPGPGHGGRWPA